MEKYTTNSNLETRLLGEQFAKKLKRGAIVFLKGDLGAGKTTFVQGVAQGLNIKQVVNSPTFNIQKVYQGDLVLNHIDAYRLEGIHQDLGFEDYFDEDTLTFIEWSEFIESDLPHPDYRINIKVLGENEREITIEGEDQL